MVFHSVQDIQLFFQQNKDGLVASHAFVLVLLLLALFLHSKAVRNMFLPYSKSALIFQLCNWVFSITFLMTAIRTVAVQQQIRSGLNDSIAHDKTTIFLCFFSLVYLLGFFSVSAVVNEEVSSEAASNDATSTDAEVQQRTSNSSAVVNSIAASGVFFFISSILLLSVDNSTTAKGAIVASILVWVTTLFQVARHVSSTTTLRDGSDFQSTILGSTRLLSNPDSVLGRDGVAARFNEYNNLYCGARQQAGAISTDESIKKRQDEYKLMVDSFYDLVTDFYEYGWGQSFHFANRFKDETFFESIKRVEYFLSGKLGLNKNSYCLDMGCGIGGPMRNIARFSGAKIKGITINEYQVRVGNRNNNQIGLDKQCHVVQGNFMEMPFESSTFDGIYAIESVCHAPSKKLCFTEAFRVLKSGGTFVGLDWAMVNKYDASNIHHIELKEGIEVGNGLPTIETPQQIAKALEDAGFEVIEHYSIQDSDRVEHETPWYETLEGKMTLQGFRMTWLGRQCTHMLVSVLEFMKIAPKGTVKVSKMLNQTADDIVLAGKMDIFTPSYFFMARKP